MHTLKPLRPDKENAVANARVKIFKHDIEPEKAERLLAASATYIQEFWQDQVKNGIKIKIPENTDELFPGQAVPELYHYTWFSCHSFNIIHFISMYRQWVKFN